MRGVHCLLITFIFFSILCLANFNFLRCFDAAIPNTDCAVSFRLSLMSLGHHFPNGIKTMILIIKKKVFLNRFAINLSTLFIRLSDNALLWFDANGDAYPLNSKVTNNHCRPYYLIRVLLHQF